MPIDEGSLLDFNRKLFTRLQQLRVHFLLIALSKYLLRLTAARIRRRRFHFSFLVRNVHKPWQI